MLHAIERLCGARLLRRTDLSEPGAWSDRTRVLSPGGRRSGARTGLVRLHDCDDCLFRRRLPVALRAAAAAECSAAQPARLRRGRARSGVQYVGELHHQHQLAELRRRDHHEPSHPDARSHGAQLPVGGDGSRDGLRACARICAFVSGDGRQLLGRRDPHLSLHPSADLVCRRAGLCRLGHAADACRRRRCDDARRRQAGHFHRPGGESGDHQGTRHQRRRLLQRQRGAPVRKSQRLDQHPGNLGAAADPRNLRTRVRSRGRGHAPGQGDLGGDGGLFHRRRRRRLLVGDAREIRS